MYVFWETIINGYSFEIKSSFKDIFVFSRALDTNLHTHLAVGNLTYDGAEDVWKTLSAYRIFEQVDLYTEIYRNELAAKVMSGGYQIEDHLKDGKDNGFGIAGISEAMREKYSQRSAQRDQAIAEFRKQNGREPSTREIARLVRETRDDKLTEISTAEVKARQWARLGPEERDTLDSLRREAMTRGSIREHAPAGPSLFYAAEHIFERVSVAKEHDLKAEALRHGRGRIDLDELRGILLGEVATGNMLEARGEVATKETLDRERRMVALVDECLNKFEPLGRGHAFVPSDRLRAEQKEALRAVLASRDLVFNLSGAAGVGKTTLLKELRYGLIEARQNVSAIAPTAKAVQELQNVGFQNAVTIARLLNDPQLRHELAGQVLVVDEAGMVSSRDMAELIALAKSSGARIVYSGDTAQIKSVEAGDALRVLERESNMKGVSLREVVRQTDAEYRDAVETIRNHPAEGYSKLDAMGAIREVDWRDKPREVARIYREAAVLNRHGKQRSVLIEASTYDEIKSITHAIRQDRVTAGEINQGQTLKRHEALNWTGAQKKQFRKYQPGMILEFHKAVQGAQKNEALEVVSADKTGIVARKATGETVQIAAKQAKAFGVFQKQNIEVSVGDKLLLQANRREKGFRLTNGELVTVAHIEAGGIHLEDGRTMPADYRQFTHGYAITVHQSQGASVDFNVVMGDRMKKSDFYVAVSRGKEGVAVVTSDSLGLQESIGVSDDRQSAIELERRTTPARYRRKLEDFELHEARHAHEPRQEVRQREANVQVQERAGQQQKSELKQEKEKEIAHTHAAGIGF